MGPVLLICVNYKNHKQTRDFIQNVLSVEKSENLSVCLVNQDVDGDGHAYFEDLQSNSRFLYLRTDQNLGYFGSAHWAWEQLGQKLRWSWVIVSNTDLKLQTGIVETLEMTAPVIGVLGPSITSELSHLETNPYFLNRPSSFKMHFIKWVFAAPLTNQLYQWLGLAKAVLKRLLGPSASPDRQEGLFCYAVHGAFMVFSHKYFAEGGDFKHPVFLYNEEIKVAEFCREKALKIYFEPRIRLLHQEHGSIGLLYSSSILKYKAEAAKYFADRYF